MCWGLFPVCLGQTGTPLELEGRRRSGVGCSPHPAALSSSYLCCPVNAAQYLQEAGRFPFWHLSLYCWDHSDLDFVRSSFSASSSVLRTAGAGQSLADKSSNERFLSCLQTRSEHIFILGFYFKVSCVPNGG